MITFETSKGKFAIIDKPIFGVTVIDRVDCLTEEQWSEVVDTFNHHLAPFKYKDYNPNSGFFLCESATESGKSLLDSLGIKGDNWLLVKYEL